MSDPIEKDPNATTLDLLNTIKLKVAGVVFEGAKPSQLLGHLLVLADRFMNTARLRQAATEEDVAIATDMAVCATALAVLVDAHFQIYAAAASDAAKSTRH